VLVAAPREGVVKLYSQGSALELESVKKLALFEAPMIARSKQVWVNASKLRKSR
jgi:hypothetical protein